MLEILQYVTSGFWIFLGCTIFCTAVLSVVGWALNAVIIGFRGKSVPFPDIF